MATRLSTPVWGLPWQLLTQFPHRSHIPTAQAASRVSKVKHLATPLVLSSADAVMPRRMVLAGLGTLAVLEVAGCGHQPAFHPQTATARFMTASRRLTGYGDLDGMLGGRIEGILRQRVTRFDDALAALGQALSVAASPLSLTHLPAPAAGLAGAILRAWQTGVVGEGAQAVVVSYEDALMYRPIADVCVLPTYARGAPHYWAQPVTLPAPGARA